MTYLADLRRSTPQERGIAISLVLGALSMTSMMSITSQARADTRIVATVAMETSDSSVPPQTVTIPKTLTVYLSENQARRETSDGTIVLADREARKVWVLNPAAKTYWSKSIADYLSPTSGLVLLQQSPLSPQASVHLETVKAGAPNAAPSPSLLSNTSSKEASQLSLSGMFFLEPKIGGGGGRGGGFGGGGIGGGRRGGIGRSGGVGFPSGNTSPNPSSSSPSAGGGNRLGPNSRLFIAGSSWTDAWKNLADLSDKALEDLSFLLTEETLPLGNPLRKAWGEQITKKKVLPLAATITTTNSSTRIIAPSNPTPEQTRLPTQVITHFTVTGIEKGLSFSADMFRIPDGFTEVPAPEPTASKAS